MGTAWYATREDIRSALDSASAARSDAQVDRALDAATRQVSELCQRDFAPVLGTRYFDWPSEQTPRSWRLWLDRNEILSASLVVSGGVTIPATDYLLEPANYGPPYSNIQIRLDRQSAWTMASTHQRAIAITGLYGYSDDAAPAGALVGAIDATTTTAQVTDSSLIGVGDLIRVGAERMAVTGRRLASTGQTVQAALGAKASDTLVTVTNGAAYHEDELLTLDAERMRITDIAGNTLIVKRAQDGTVLAAHTGSPIYAPRLLTVARAAAGTTAAAAADGAPVTRWVPPAPVHNLTVAEAMNTLLQEQAGYLRTAGSSSGSSAGKEATLDALKDLRAQVSSSHGRQARTRAV